MARSLVSIPSVRNPKVISEYADNMRLKRFKAKDLYFLIITEDAADKGAYSNELKENDLEGEVLGLSGREKFMRENGISEYSNLIPKRSHAETSFGLIHMLLNREFEYGFFIDDDTRPINRFDYFGDHIKNLNFSGETDSVMSDSGWVNVLYQTFGAHRLYPRGHPYSKMNEKTTVTKKRIGNKNRVYISHGLWTNVPDLDAIRILMDGDLNGQAKTRLTEQDYKGNFVTEHGCFQSVCSMNLAFRREIIPSFYQFPMDDNPYRIGRFDDIWSGIIAKSVIDALDGYVINCYPLCEHNKAPRSTFKDVASESPGYESNEFFSETIREIGLDGKDVSQMTRKMAEALSTSGRTEFTRYCGKYLNRWLDLCDKLG